MKRLILMLVMLSLACGCRHAKHTACVSVVVQFRDPAHVTQKPPELRLEYKIEDGPVPPEQKK